MIRALNTGVQGMRQFQTALDVIGNNLANINTVGFKGSRVDFADTLNQTLRAPTPDTTATSGVAGMQVGNGSAISTIKNSFSQGAVSQTGVPSDLAVTGDGFFLVKDPVSGEVFASRAGDFREDNQGNLVNNTGLRLQGIADMMNASTTVGDIKVDRGSYAASATISSLDTTTDQITLGAGHGLVTGKQVNFATTGTLPVSVPALAAGMAYFARVSGNIVTRHTTAAGAAADSDKVNFTGVGTGTHSLAPGASVSSWSVGADGKVNMLLTDGSQYVRGQVLLQKFTNPNALMRQGQNLYSNLNAAGALASPIYTATSDILARAGAPQSQGLGRIESGSLELSNVDMAKEFATMITTQRAFQANARVITTSDEVLMEMMQLKR